MRISDWSSDVCSSDLDMYGIPSRFLREIPAALLHEVRPKVQVSRPMHANAPRRNLGHAFVHETPAIALGQNVTHAKFGSGIVTHIECAGPHARVPVNLDNYCSTLLALTLGRYH